MAMNLQLETLPRNPDFAESFDVYMCNGFSLPSFAIKFLKEEASSFKAREDDVYVVSYPKTGTTWTQEIVYLIHSNLNFEAAKSKDLSDRFPYVEHARTDIHGVVHMPSPRLIKSHLPYSVLPPDIVAKKCKIIYVTRNPKDVVVSYFHFARWLNETRYQGTFDQFFERFLQNRPTYGPFLQHNLEFWNLKDQSNILFLFYEDLQKDLAGNVKKIAEFLDKSLTDEEITAIMEHCSFTTMSGNRTVAPPTNEAVDGNPSKFFRKGKVGDWRNNFSEEQNARMDKWIEKGLEGSDLEYTYEL